MVTAYPVLGERLDEVEPVQGAGMDECQDRLKLQNRAVGGETAALTMLLLDSAPRLTAYIAARIPRNLRGSLDAEDIAQEAHVEIYRHITTFEDRGPDSFDRWVTTIALRKLRTALTRSRADKRGGGQTVATFLSKPDHDSVCILLDLMVAPGRSPSGSVAGHEAVDAVRAGLEFLSEDHRQVVSLVYLEGWSVAAAAHRMGRSEQAVYNLCDRAKHRLRDVLQSASHYLSSSG